MIHVSGEMLVGCRECNSVGIVRRSSSSLSRGAGLRLAIAASRDIWNVVHSSRGSNAAMRRAWRTLDFRLSVLTSPRLVKSWGRPDRQFLSWPVRKLTEADGTASLFVFGDLVLILASFLHVVTVAGLDPVGAVDFLAHGTLLCHGINDTSIVGGESRWFLASRTALVFACQKIKG